MTTQAILFYKVSFIGLCNTEYVQIMFKNGGLIINKLEREEAKRIIQDENLILQKEKDYSGEYDPKKGRIYADANFKTTVNAVKSRKKFVLDLLETIL